VFDKRHVVFFRLKRHLVSLRSSQVKNLRVTTCIDVKSWVSCSPWYKYIEVTLLRMRGRAGAQFVYPYDRAGPQDHAMYTKQSLSCKPR
jgi:hypothetical protein